MILRTVLLFLLTLMSVMASEESCDFRQAKNSTIWNEKILERNKRFLIFNNGGNVKVRWVLENAKYLMIPNNFDRS
jgi:hypothetical protein